MKQSEKIRRYFKKYPFAKPKVASEELGIAVTAIYNARSAMRKKVSPTPKRMGRPKKVEAPVDDLVNHPPHYTTGGVETIDFIEAKNLNYNLGNAVKYITRADHKGNRVQDLEKARWYIEREILSAHVK